MHIKQHHSILGLYVLYARDSHESAITLKIRLFLLLFRAYPWKESIDSTTK